MGLLNQVGKAKLCCSSVIDVPKLVQLCRTLSFSYLYVFESNRLSITPMFRQMPTHSFLTFVVVCLNLISKAKPFYKIGLVCWAPSKKVYNNVGSWKTCMNLEFSLEIGFVISDRMPISPSIRLPTSSPLWLPRSPPLRVTKTTSL
jgi:hypothetical protein